MADNPSEPVDRTSEISALKKAALGAVMREEGYQHIAGSDSWSQHIGEAKYEVAFSGNGGDVSTRISYTNPDIQVTHSYTQEREDRATKAFVERFEQISQDIDWIMEPWQTIPTKKGIVTAKRQSNEMVTYLMGSVTEKGSVMSASGELSGVLDLATRESAGAFGGGAFDTFKIRYVGGSVSRAIRLTALGETISQAVDSEAEIWSKAETDVTKILAEYTSQFEALSPSSSGEIDLVFSVAGAALAGALLFPLSAAATTVVTATSIALNLAASIAESATNDDAPPTKSKFTDVNSGLTGFKATFSELSQAIYTEESALLAGLDATRESIRDYADLFQLEPAPLYSVDREIMHVDPIPAYGIARTYLPEASTQVTAQVNKPTNAANDLSEALEHDYAAGYREYGAVDGVRAIAYLTKTLLKEFAFDLDRGATNLEIAIDEWQTGEETKQRELEAYAAEIEGNIAHNGKDHDDLIV